MVHLTAGVEADLARLVAYAADRLPREQHLVLPEERDLVDGGKERPVPIPPVLVAILRAHVDAFGAAKEGRVFGNERGGVVGSSTYWRVWEEAREYALPPERVVSPLAGRPYDLRHACITRWLNAGVPIAEVARRVGNSPEVIHRRYHGCIDGHEEAANAKITRALEEDGDAA